MPAAKTDGIGAYPVMEARIKMIADSISEARAPPICQAFHLFQQAAGHRHSLRFMLPVEGIL